MRYQLSGFISGTVPQTVLPLMGNRCCTRQVLQSYQIPLPDIVLQNANQKCLFLQDEQHLALISVCSDWGGRCRSEKRQPELLDVIIRNR